MSARLGRPYFWEHQWIRTSWRRRRWDWNPAQTLSSWDSGQNAPPSGGPSPHTPRESLDLVLRAPTKQCCHQAETEELREALPPPPSLSVLVQFLTPPSRGDPGHRSSAFNQKIVRNIGLCCAPTLAALSQGKVMLSLSFCDFCPFSFGKHWFCLLFVLFNLKVVYCGFLEEVELVLLRQQKYCRVLWNQ